MKLFILFHLLFVLNAANAENPWVHIELGAGNYGPKGGEGVKAGPDQYLNLYRALESMIRTKGESGVIYINDYDRTAADFAASQLRNYCKKHNYSEIEVRVLVGDYTTLALPQADTIHLRYPEPSLFSDPVKMSPVLQRIANHAKQGLEVTTYAENFFNEYQNRGLRIKITDRNPLPYLNPAGIAHVDGDGYIPPSRTYLIHRTSGCHLEDYEKL